MRVNDAVTGAVLLVLSLAVVWHVRSFPTIPGQPYGAALYPLLVGCGLAVSSVLLIVSGLRSRRPVFGNGPIAGAHAGVEPDAGPGDAGDVDAGAGAVAERRPVAFAATVASLLFYLFFAERLGFIVCSMLMLIALFWTYGVRRALVVPLAIAATLLIHYGFYKLLKVPLPWGVLQSFAW